MFLAKPWPGSVRKNPLLALIERAESAPALCDEAYFREHYEGCHIPVFEDAEGNRIAVLASWSAKRERGEVIELGIQRKGFEIHEGYGLVGKIVPTDETFIVPSSDSEDYAFKISGDGSMVYMLPKRKP